MKIVFIASIFFLSACGVESSTTPAPVVAAQATQIYSAANAQVAQAQQDYAAAQESYRATVAASERFEATASAVQATLDASAINEARVKAQAAEVALSIAQDDLQLHHLEVISETHAVTTTIALRSQDFSRQQRQDNSVYQVVDFIYYTAPRLAIGILLPAILILLLWRVGGTLVGWLQKKVTVGNVTYILTDAGPIALLPPPPAEMVIDNENTAKTGNTETVGNAENTAGNSVSELIPASNNGHPGVILKMTPEERAELMATRHEAIGLLSKCVDYYKRTGGIDDGTIPRYDAIGMNAEARGLIVDNLVYSGLASKIANKRSFIFYEIGTCAVALNLIVTNQRRVYPVGYHDRRQQRFDAALKSIPQREVIA